MAIVKLKPTSAGRRAQVKVVNPDLYKGRPVDALIEKQTKNAGRNNYGRVTAYNVSDGQDIVHAQELADTATGYSPTEVAVQVILGGRTMRRVADPQLLERTGRILHNAYDLKEDSDGCTQLASFTGTTIGSAGTVISPGHVASAAARACSVSSSI